MILLFPLFIVVTLVEIYFIIKVGAAVGAFSTILLIILTALIGSYLLKQQGFATLNNVKNSFNIGVLPQFEILEGVVILISGALLLTPGFLTDIIGLLGLIPYSRRYILDYYIAKNNTVKYQQEKDTIEVEYWQEK